MDPMTAMAIASAIPQVTKAITGISQKQKGKQLAQEAIRPDYKTPESVLKAVDIAKALSAGELPGVDQYRSDISQVASQGMAGVIESAQSPAAVAQMASTLNTQQGQQLRDINTRQADYKTRIQQAYSDAMKYLGGFEQKEWEMNKFNPFVDKARAAEAMTGAGMQNVQSGVEGVATSGINYLSQTELFDSNDVSNKTMEEIINSIYGEGNASGAFTDINTDPNQANAIVSANNSPNGLEVTGGNNIPYSFQ